MMERSCHDLIVPSRLVVQTGLMDLNPDPLQKEERKISFWITRFFPKGIQ